jgi:hypothetical protein
VRFGDTRNAPAPTEDSTPSEAPAVPTRMGFRMRDVRETSPEPATKPLGDTRGPEPRSK